MTDSMRERLARIICVKEGVDPEKECIGLGKLLPVGESVPAWKVRLGIVDVILDELSEPTEAMVRAGVKHEWSGGYDRQGSHATGNYQEFTESLGLMLSETHAHITAEEVFRAMIGAAKEPE